MQNPNAEEVIQIEQIDTRGQQQVVLVNEPSNVPAKVVYQQPVLQPQNFYPQADPQIGLPPQQYQQPQQGFQQQPYPQQYPQYLPGQQQYGYQTVPQVQILQAPAPFPSHSACRFPLNISCPYCNQVGFTTCDKVAKSKTYIWCCCLFIFCCPLMCVPFCCDDCMAVKSYCSACSDIYKQILI